jgi:hypothetical protein
MSPQDIQLLSDSARAAYLIKQRLEYIQQELNTKAFDTDITALANMSLGLVLIVDKLNAIADVPAEFN